MDAVQEFYRGRSWDCTFTNNEDGPTAIRDLLEQVGRQIGSTAGVSLFFEPSLYCRCGTAVRPCRISPATAKMSGVPSAVRGVQAGAVEADGRPAFRRAGRGGRRGTDHRNLQAA